MEGCGRSSGRSVGLSVSSGECPFYSTSQLSGSERDKLRDKRLDYNNDKGYVSWALSFIPFQPHTFCCVPSALHVC